jgi:hypothetical protein
VWDFLLVSTVSKLWKKWDWSKETDVMRMTLEMVCWEQVPILAGARREMVRTEG